MEQNVKQFSGNFASRLTPEAAAQLNEIAAKAAEQGTFINSGSDMLNYLLTLQKTPPTTDVNAPELNEGEVLIVVNEADYNAQTEFYKTYANEDIETIKSDLQAAVDANKELSDQLQQAITEAGKFVNGEFFAADDPDLELVWVTYRKRKAAGKTETLKSLVSGVFRLIMIPKINAQIDISEKLSAREYLLNLPQGIKDLYK